MIGSINTIGTRANWATVQGRTVQLTVNASNQYTKETYIDETATPVLPSTIPTTQTAT